MSQVWLQKLSLWTWSDVLERRQGWAEANNVIITGNEKVRNKSALCASASVRTFIKVRLAFWPRSPPPWHSNTELPGSSAVISRHSSETLLREAHNAVPIEIYRNLFFSCTCNNCMHPRGGPIRGQQRGSLLFELCGKTPVVFVVFRPDWFLPVMDQVVITLPASYVALAWSSQRWVLVARKSWYH